MLKKLKENQIQSCLASKKLYTASEEGKITTMLLLKAALELKNTARKAQKIAAVSSVDKAYWKGREEVAAWSIIYLIKMRQQEIRVGGKK